MDAVRYITLVLGRTFQRSVSITDRASILLGPAITAYFWLRGGPMPSGLDGLVAVGILLTAGGALLLRLLAAPYLIWKEDQASARELLERLDHPKRQQHVEMSKYGVELRKKLSKRLAEFIKYAQLSSNEELYKRFVVPNASKMLRKQEQVNNILWQLGHDVMLRLACWNLITYCTETISMSAKGNFDAARADRIRKQSRYTMSLIHNPTGDEHAMALANIETILSRDGESLFKFEGSPRRLPADTAKETQP